MGFKIGSTQGSKIFIGSTEVTSATIGQTLVFQSIVYDYVFSAFTGYTNVASCTVTTPNCSGPSDVGNVQTECQCVFSAWSAYSATAGATATAPNCGTGVVQREVETRSRSVSGNPSQLQTRTRSATEQSFSCNCVSCNCTSFSCNCTSFSCNCSSFACNCTTSSVCSGGSFGGFGAWSGYNFSTAGSTSWSCGCSRCGQTGVQGECVNLFGGPVCRRRTRTCNCSTSQTCQTCTSCQTCCQTCQSCSSCNCQTCCTSFACNCQTCCSSFSCNCQTCSSCNCSGYSAWSNVSSCSFESTCDRTRDCQTVNTCSCGGYGSWSNTSSCANESHQCGQTRECQTRTRTGQNQQRIRTCQRVII